jgi:hypothetical protein
MAHELVINEAVCSRTGKPVRNCKCGGHKGPPPAVARNKRKPAENNDDEDEDDEDEDEDEENENSATLHKGASRNRRRPTTLLGNLRPVGGEPLIPEASLPVFNQQSNAGPLVLGRNTVAGGGEDLYRSDPSQGNRDSYEEANDDHVDTSEGEDLNEETYPSMSRQCNSISLVIPGSEHAFSHGVSAIGSAEAGDYAGAARSHRKAALAHERAGTTSVKNQDGFGGDHMRAASGHRQMANIYDRLTKVVGNRRRPRFRGTPGTPLLLTPASLAFNYGIDSGHSFDRSPGTQVLGSDSMRVGGPAEGLESPPRKNLPNRDEQPDQGEEPPLDADQAGVPRLTEPFDGRGLAVTKRRKGDKRGVTDPRGHPSSGTDDDLEDAAIKGRYYREDQDSDNLERLGMNFQQQGLALNRDYQDQIRQGLLPPTAGGVMEVLRLERLASCPGLAR